MEETSSQPIFKKLDRSLREQKIIDTAMELFHIKGYKATTLDDVSKQLGITKAALYHYVSSKEEILYTIYLQALENIFRKTSKVSEMDLPPDEKLKLIIENHIKNIIIHSISMFSVFFTEENQLSEQNFKKIQQEKRKYNLIVEKIIENGISQGLFKNVNPRLQANAIIGMCNWVYKWYKPGHSPYSPDQIADHFTGLLETGYLKNNIPGDRKDLGILTHADTEGTSGIKPFEELRAHCVAIVRLIDKIEKS